MLTLLTVKIKNKFFANLNATCNVDKIKLKKQKKLEFGPTACG